MRLVQTRGIVDIDWQSINGLVFTIICILVIIFSKQFELIYN